MTLSEGALFRRQAPREDNLRATIAQRVSERYRLGDRLWSTQEPLVRMDIQTAVQISLLSDRPLGIVELLTESSPVHLDPLGGPAVTTHEQLVSDTVTRAHEIMERLRSLGARRDVSFAAVEREWRIIRTLGWICAALTVTLVAELVLL